MECLLKYDYPIKIAFKVIKKNAQRQNDLETIKSKQPFFYKQKEWLQGLNII